MILNRTWYLFLAIAFSKFWPIHYLDVNNTFLHGQLDEQIYMIPPEDYFKVEDGKVRKLKYSLYGFKHVS